MNLTGANRNQRASEHDWLRSSSKLWLYAGDLELLSGLMQLTLLVLWSCMGVTGA